MNLGDLWLLLVVSVSITAATTDGNHNHIFNAIHSAMRQWGSSLNHNGMSFFLARVPKGVHLYHGRRDPEPVRGVEWLAFEVEHAMFLAANNRAFTLPETESSHRISPGQRVLGPDLKSIPETQQEKDRRKKEEEEEPGWVQTYVTTTELRLLYIDGLSGAKSHNGTLDSQARIMLNDTFGFYPGKGSIPEEYEEARAICRLAQERWGGRIDGVIRMETGFEVILCSFEDHLALEYVTRSQPGDMVMEGDWSDPPRGYAKWMNAVASRYHGIGGGRVFLDFDHFVTAYHFGLDLFPAGGGTMPRLTHIPTSQLEPVRRSLDDLILHGYVGDDSGVPWQAITDLIVARYARPLRNLTAETPTLDQIHKTVNELLSPFTDYYARDHDAEVDRCTGQFLSRRGTSQGVAGEAVWSVARTICLTLVRVREAMELDDAVKELRELVDYLQWTTWKECGPCAMDEYCRIPIWPTGTVEDREHPRCNGPLGLGGEDGYWGGSPLDRYTDLETD